MTSKMNCLGCKKDKPMSDFPSANSPLCKRCKGARISTSGKSNSGSNGSWIGDIIEGIADAIGDMLN